MLEPWRNGRIIRIDRETSATWHFWIEIPELDVFDFKPGQFVTLDLPIHEKKNKRWRSYSIASAPDGTNVIELVIVLLEDGAGTNYLFHEVKEGSEVLLRGPQGVFTLPETLEKDLFLVCTGTGIAPFRSMINYIHRNHIPHRDIHLIFGCRKFGDALYRNEMEILQQQEPGFFYHPVFSREEQVGQGEHMGYVHGVYETLVKAEKNPASFFLCGWKNMIDEARQRLQDLGYDKKDIHFELYG